MKTYWDFQCFEWKRFFNKRNLIVFGAVILLSLLFTWPNVSKLKTMQAHNSKFQDYEKKKVENWLNYRLYGLHGFRIITMPTPIGILSLNSSPFPQLIANVDTSEELPVYRVMMSNDSLRTTFKWFLDYSGVMMVLGALLALMFGFETLRHNKYLKLLSSIGRRWPVYFASALARSVMLAFFFLVALVLNYALIAIRGVVIPLGWSLPALFVSLVLLAFFFFAVGVILGTFKDKSTVLSTAVAIFFLSIFGIQALADHLAFGDEGSIPSMYEIELNKMKILYDYERMLKNKYGPIKVNDKPSKEESADWDSFLNKEYKEIQAYNDKIIEKVRSNANRYKWLSALFPTSYYYSVKNELSGSGYDNLVDFFRFVKKIKVDFFYKYIEVMRTNPNAKVEQFLKGDDNVIQSKPHVPEQFPLGTLMAILYFSILLWAGYANHKKSLIALPQKTGDLFDGDDIFLDYDDTEKFVDYDGLLEEQLYCLLANGGKEFKSKGYEFDVKLGGVDLVTNKNPLDFLYICRREYFPADVKTGPFFSLLMGLAGVPKEDRQKLVSKYRIDDIAKQPVCSLDSNGFENFVSALLHLRECKIYLIGDVTKGWPGDRVERLKELLEKRKETNGAAVLFLTSNSPFTELAAGQKRPYFMQSSV